MQVMITKVNEDFIAGLLPKVKFVESTKNTSIFEISEAKLKKLIEKTDAMGINRYALFYF